MLALQPSRSHFSQPHHQPHPSSDPDPDLSDDDDNHGEGPSSGMLRTLSGTAGRPNTVASLLEESVKFVPERINRGEQVMPWVPVNKKVSYQVGMARRVPSCWMCESEFWLTGFTPSHSTLSRRPSRMNQPLGRKSTRQLPTRPILLHHQLRRPLACQAPRSRRSRPPSAGLDSFRSEQAFTTSATRKSTTRYSYSAALGPIRYLEVLWSRAAVIAAV